MIFLLFFDMFVSQKLLELDVDQRVQSISLQLAKWHIIRLHINTFSWL